MSHLYPTRYIDILNISLYVQWLQNYSRYQVKILHFLVLSRPQNVIKAVGHGFQSWHFPDKPDSEQFFSGMILDTYFSSQFKSASK